MKNGHALRVIAFNHGGTNVGNREEMRWKEWASAQTWNAGKRQRLLIVNKNEVIGDIAIAFLTFSLVNWSHIY